MPGRWTDQINLASKLTVKKSVNAFRVLTSFYQSRATGRPQINGLPIALSIEPTTSCNLRCPECPSGLRSFTRPTGMLGEGLFRQTIDELKDTLTWLTFYFQGEPYLHPAFTDMVGYASSQGIYTATSTNGHFLKDDTAEKTIASGLDRLIISIDGTTQATYESYRVGGSLQKVLDGAAKIIEWKRKMKSKTPHVVFQFLVVRQNEHEIPEVYKLAKHIGIDEVVLKTAQIYEFEKGSPFIPMNEKYSRYSKGSDGRYRIKSSLLNHCWKMWHSSVVTWDGKVVPCCFDKDAQFQMGDLNKQPFREIWLSEKYRTFRSTLLGSRNEIEICRNCTEGTKVWA